MIGIHLRTLALLRVKHLLSTIARMSQSTRLPAALLLTLGFSISPLAGCSDSSSAPAVPLRILVTNDDGVGAEGIDAIIEALVADPNNQVVVSAPAENSSGSGDWTVNDPSPSPPAPPCATGTGEATPASTLSGYDQDVWAVDGCPADAVIYGLANLYPDEPPHVVLSGINQGQNVGNVGTAGFASQISGTVGAAKTAACADVPALASSQGHGETINYPSGVEEVLRWLEENRAALLAGQVAVENITSINIPSCDTGKIRGRLQVLLATENPNDYNLVNGDQDCESTLENPPNDIEAFYNGFTSIAPVPRNSNMTCDKLD